MATSRRARGPGLQLLEQAAFPIYLLDDSRRIVYCNPACAQWLDCENSELVGRRCDYHSGGDVTHSDPLAAGLCPPPTAWAGQRGRATVVAGPSRGSTAADARMADCIPLGVGQDKAVGVLVVVSDERVSEPQPAATEPPDAQQLHGQLRRLHARLTADHDIDRLVGTSAAMDRVRDQVRLASLAPVRVVVAGPAGSGRERVARTIHLGQTAGRQPYLVPLACPLLDAELLETTIEAFVRSCAELSEEHPASLLLLEVDQLPEDAQACLLGFLKIAELQLHTLATARESLLGCSARGPFREELAQLLSTLVIEIPPLGERIEDVPLLAQAAIEQINVRGERQVAGLTEKATNCLLRYGWPGNADELFQLMDEAHRAASGPYITDQDLPERISLAWAAAEHPRREEPSIELDRFLADVERELIRRSLGSAKGNKARAARSLGISRARLLRRMEALEIS